MKRRGIISPFGWTVILIVCAGFAFAWAIVALLGLQVLQARMASAAAAIMLALAAIKTREWW